MITNTENIYSHFDTNDGRVPLAYDSLKIIRKDTYSICIFRYHGTGYIRWNLYHKGLGFPLSLDAVPPYIGKIAEKEIRALTGEIK